MSRPTSYAGWASGASGYVVEPIASVKALGWQAGQAPPASYMNWLQGLGYQWQRYLDRSVAAEAFGDGSDGTVTVNNATGPSWVTAATPSGFIVYTMIRPAACKDLTVSWNTTQQVRLETVGYPLFVNGMLSVDAGSKITCNGGDGGAIVGPSVPGAAGLGGGGNLTGGGAPGATGGITPNTPVTPGPSVINSLGGGGGGAVASGLAGATGGGSATPPAANLGDVRFGFNDRMGFIIGSSGGVAALTAIRGGAGGAGAGGNIAVAGAGGGGGGGVLAIAARELNLYGATCLQAAGGAGGSNAGFSGDGGGGGGGGLLRLIYQYSIQTITFAAAVNCPGGPPGPQVAYSHPPLAGANGQISVSQLGDV